MQRKMSIAGEPEPSAFADQIDTTQNLPEDDSQFVDRETRFREY